MTEVDVATQWVYFWNILEVLSFFCAVMGTANWLKFACGYISNVQTLHFPMFTVMFWTAWYILANFT